MTVSLQVAGGVIALSLIDADYTRDAHHQETRRQRAADADADLMASGVINAAKSPSARPID